MRLIGTSLAQQGLAFLSYNADPGCRIRQILRDLMLDATRECEGPAEKVEAAHAILERFIEAWSETDPFQNALKDEARDMLKRPPALLFHDELGAFYAPQRLRDVVEAARSVGLAYLCDTRPKEIAEALSPSGPFLHTPEDWVRFEQFQDFAEMRRFRQTILCRADGTIDRRFIAKRFQGLWATSDIARDDSDAQDSDGFAFRAGNGAEFTTGDPRLADFLTRLGEAFPSALRIDDVARDESLAQSLLALFSAKIVNFSTSSLPFTLTPGEHPLASPLARAQAAKGERVLASLRHKAIRMEDEGSRDFIGLLDGTRSRADLASEMSSRSGLSREQAEAKVTTALAEITKLGLMMG
jgi:hypothetical protein